MDAPTHVMFLFEMGHRRLRLKTQSKQKLRAQLVGQEEGEEGGGGEEGAEAARVVCAVAQSYKRNVTAEMVGFSFCWQALISLLIARLHGCLPSPLLC